MADIQGATNALPGPFTLVQTQSASVAIPGGSRVTAMIGQGQTNGTIVAQAQGGGQDGLNATYTSTTGSDGRHFLIAGAPLIPNRTTLFKNGIPLVGQESVITATTTFSDQFDYLLDPTTGQILLQSANLVDQGGAFYVPLVTNVGLGSINALTLLDANAPPEIWTIRCVSVQRNSMNQPIGGTAQFLAIGSVSGAQVDGNGNPILWTANNVVVNNSILSFSIVETVAMSVVVSPFVPGDAFTIEVASGVLLKNDSLTATYIPVSNINAPTLTQGLGAVISQFGTPSASNSLSLGAQLFYANGASSLICLQAAPPLPRRTFFDLSNSVNSGSTNPDDFVFPLPVGVVPAFDDDIYFFVTNNTTQVEEQILPNKLTYYTLDTAGNPTEDDFIFDNTPAPVGNSYFYTVIQGFETVVTGFDGYISRDPAFTNRGYFSSSVIFDLTYIGLTLKVIDSNNVANIGSFTVTNVTDGQLYFMGTLPFPDMTNVAGTEAFQLIDPSTDLVIASGTDGTVVKSVGTGNGTITSTAVDFSTIAEFVANPTFYKLQINNDVNNEGLYDISGYSAIGNVISLIKTVVSEHSLRYEVIDPTLESNYIVINHNVVPNGYALAVNLVDNRDATFYDAGWLNALAALETVECDILVPLPNQTISVIFQNCVNHVITMSNIVNKKERVLFIGAINGLTPANLTGAQLAAVEDLGPLEGIPGSNPSLILQANPQDLANYSVAAAYGDTFRVVYFFPDQIVVQAGANNIMIDGFYIAAAAAGYESADVIIQNPLTNKVISGFTILGNKTYSTLILEQLAAAGVCTLQPVAGGGNVVWGLTTSQSGFPEEQEISIVFIRDRVAKSMRAGFQGFIGTPQDINTAAALNTEAVDILNSLVGQGLITAYTNLSVAQDTIDPRQWNISVSVSPAYPINWIFIKINIGQLNLSGSAGG